MKKSFMNVSLFLIFLSVPVLIYSCSCTRTSKQESKIPSGIMQKADNYISFRTGKEFFKKYITPDFSKMKKIESGYFMDYRFKMPDKPYVDNEIRFTIDSHGNVETDKEIVGIPDCGSDPGSCDFSITEEQAKKIAAENGLPKGIKDWSAKFTWDTMLNKYVWEIISTESETPSGETSKSSGNRMIIDPNSGKVLASKVWKIH